MRTSQFCLVAVMVCVCSVVEAQLVAADDGTAPVVEGLSIESSKVAPEDEKARELMDAICAGGVEMARTGDFDGVVLECDSCPDGASTDDGTLQFQKGFVGDFSGDGTKEAIVATTGCGQGFNFRHSTVVADRSSEGWEKAEYRDGINVEHCELVDVSESQRLLCETTDVGQGIAHTQVSLRGIRDGSLSSDNLVELLDKRGACRFEGEFVREVSEKVIDDINGDGRTEIGFVLRTKTGGVAGDSQPTDPCEEGEYDIDEEESLRVWSVDTDGVTRNSDVERSGLHPEKEDDTASEEKEDRDVEWESDGGCFSDVGRSSDDRKGIDLCSGNPFQQGF